MPVLPAWQRGSGVKKMKVNCITDLIGNTPLVRINNINDGNAIIYAKLESFNPLQSAKDRVASAMISEAEKNGVLKKGSVIIEPTSGNTGIGLAYIAAVKGYKLILVMPDSMSEERKKLLKALGAELELTEGAKGMAGSIAKADELAAKINNACMLRQFGNPANPEAHEKTTGPEIWNDTEGKVDVLVACVGTGGTVTGTGRYLKSRNPAIKVIAVEPSASAVLSGGKAGPHEIQGIGAGFIPQNYDKTVVDEIIRVDDAQAGNICRRLIKEEGIFAGISSGAAMDAAMRVSRRSENGGKIITAIFPDSGERYLSTWVWNLP